MTTDPWDRVRQLQLLLDEAYAGGSSEGIEDLEAELEGLLDRAEDTEPGEVDHDTCGLSAEEELIELWHRWHGVGSVNSRHAADLQADEISFAKFVRRATRYMIRPETTDKMIEVAARDAAETYARRYGNLKAVLSKSRLDPVTILGAR